MTNVVMKQSGAAGIHCVAAASALFWLLLAAEPLHAADPTVRWPAPTLTEDNFDEWLTFIRPSENDLKWRQIRWHKELEVAAREARELNRPILLWTMNGHPCGET